VRIVVLNMGFNKKLREMGQVIRFDEFSCDESGRTLLFGKKRFKSKLPKINYFQ